MLRHTLIVGKTGAGKTYFERQIIDKIIKDHSGQLVLLDTKVFELDDYQTSEMCVRYADNMGDVYDALRYATDEMDSRMKTLKRKRAEGEKITEWPYLPLYVFVDELMDLMVSDHKAEYTDMLQRIARLGRAEKVFLVGCTQLPTREYVPNIIRDNVDNKVCFRLESMRRAGYLFNCSFKQFGDLPTFGKGYIRTWKMDHVERMTNDEMLKALEV